MNTTMRDEESRAPARPLRILVIGSTPPPVGGTSVSLQLLHDQLSSDERVRVSLVNTSGMRGHLIAGPFRLLKTILSIFFLAFRVDAITLHQVPTGLAVLGPVVLAIARISGRPFVVRVFAGQDYMDLSPRKGRIVHGVVRRADLYLAQTKSLVRTAGERGLQRVEWYPTSRPMSKIDQSAVRERTQCRKFVFVGHVNNVKGVREIIEIDKRLPEGVSVDVYGPLTGGIAKEDFAGCTKVHYKGTLRNDEVIPTLQQYDALLLPTYYFGEGYPGVVIEAYAAGLPVICTRWMSLPEIVDETSGILIPTRDPEALLNAMKSLSDDENLYHSLCGGARKRSREFSLEFWADRFVSFCARLAGKPLEGAPMNDRPDATGENN